MKRALLISLALILFAPIVYAACTVPTSGMIVTSDTIFCIGLYTLPQGIEVKTDQTIVDCGNSIIEGTYNGAGVKIAGKRGVIIKNCQFEKFEQGAYLEEAPGTVFDNIVFADNTIGIASINSGFSKSNVSFNNNRNDIVEAASKEELQTQPAAQQPTTQPTTPPTQQTTLPPTEPLQKTKTVELQSSRALEEELIKKLKIDEKLVREAERDVIIQSKAVVEEQKTTFFHEILALKDTEDLAVYVKVPKELIENADLITTNWNATWIEKDPEGVFLIGKISIKTKVSLNYSVRKELSETKLKDNPVVAVPSYEKPEDIGKTKNNVWLIRAILILAVIGVIGYSYWQYNKKESL